MFKLSIKSKDRMLGVDPRLVEIADLAIQITLIDFGIPRDGGVRTAERQNELFKNGKSKADGYNNRSEHQPNIDGYGKAIDLYAYIDGHASWRPKHMAMVAAAFLQAASHLGHGVKWGGLWKSKNSNVYGWDMAHMQLID